MKLNLSRLFSDGCGLGLSSDTIRLWRHRCACMVLVLLVAAAGFHVWDQNRVLGVLPGEFEDHEAMMVAWDPRPDSPHRSLLLSLLQRMTAKMDTVVLLQEGSDEELVAQVLRAKGIDERRVEFASIPSASVWTRDFSPRVVRGEDGRLRAIGAAYRGGTRTLDSLPAIQMPVRMMPLEMEGGNLLSNGQGLVVSTERIIHQNQRKGMSEEDVRRHLKRNFGARQLLILEQLMGEPTGHVDMFLAFTDPQTVVVGQYDPERHPENASILNRNAARLSQVTTPLGPLRVVRLPMPEPTEGRWPTYTNVVFMNGTLLVPTYEGCDPTLHQQAVRTYQRLLPTWSIESLDATSLIHEAGSLHCATMNLYGRSSP